MKTKFLLPEESMESPPWLADSGPSVKQLWSKVS